MRFAGAAILASALLLAGGVAGGAEPQVATAQSLPEAADLAADVREAAKSGRAVLVLFSTVGCPWCLRARREYLVPLSRSSDGPGRVILREVSLDSDAPLVAPDGRRTTQREWGRQLGIRFSPVTMFLGPDGKEGAERIVGYPGPDFYGGYVEARVDQARAVKPAR